MSSVLCGATFPARSGTAFVTRSPSPAGVGREAVGPAGQASMWSAITPRVDSCLVDVSALDGLDRHVLRRMSEALLSAARRLAADGPCEGDAHVIATARAILRDGGCRP